MSTENEEALSPEPQTQAAAGAPDLENGLPPDAESFITKIRDILTNPDSLNNRRYTARGTPCAASWNDAWIARVEAAEGRLGRRICGARTPGNLICEVVSEHPSGRCCFHGGCAVTGGQPGNRNATIHGLYSRRLKTCGGHCPMWDSCGCADSRIEELPETNRPVCPYEQMEYDTALTGAMDRLSRNPERDGVDETEAHNYALLQVMTSRAALAVRNGSVADATTIVRGIQTKKVPRISPYIDAYLRISRERRRTADSLKAKKPEEPSLQDYLRHQTRKQSDTELDPDRRAFLTPAAVDTKPAQAERYFRQALKHAAAGNDGAAIAAACNAFHLDPDSIPAREEELTAAYRPKGHTLPQEAFNKYIKHILRLDQLTEPPEKPSWETDFPRAPIIDDYVFNPWK